MAVYPPEEERRLRLHLQEFGTATAQAGYGWKEIDVSASFESWMGAHEYRDQYFKNPGLMAPELVGFLNQLVADVRSQIVGATSPQTVVALVGAGSLYGLGDQVKVSALIERVQDAVLGRLLVFFPGEVDGNNYRLLGARDGWNYLATLITAQKG
ncbi:MAG: hypothetical protein WKF96_12945 [Solirubrobacteraceae bacterium]